MMVVEIGLGAFDKAEEDKSIHDSCRIHYHREHIIRISNCKIRIH